MLDERHPITKTEGSAGREPVQHVLRRPPQGVFHMATLGHVDPQAFSVILEI